MHGHVACAHTLLVALAGKNERAFSMLIQNSVAVCGQERRARNIAHSPVTIRRVACRVHSAKERQRWIDVVDSVEASGGKVFIFSARHESGRQLQDFSGVAAILRFGLPELEDTDPAELLAQLQL